MKIKIFAVSIILLSLLFNHQMLAQSSSANNNPGGGKFLGYDAGQNIEFRTNNTTRMQMMQTGNSNINGFNIARGGFLGLSQDPTFFTSGVASPFSLLHLNGTNSSGFPQQLGYRDWMRYGLLFTHNRDMMYVGPKRNGQDDVTDAVIAWSDNYGGTGIGPDVLRFLFTWGNGSDSQGPGSYEGLEHARMTGWGHTGIGTNWSNNSQPKRTLDVIRNDGRPQFRVTYQSGVGQDEIPGLFADFQSSQQGNLHIKPQFNTNLRATTIGFLDGEAPDPLVGTVLDVGRGRTRIRELPQISPDALIIGYRLEDVNVNDDDNFLGRLEFPIDEDSECFVLNGDGQWTNICEQLDCRWIDVASPLFAGQLDMFTGVDTEEDCYRGKVGIGEDDLNKAKLDVKNILDRDGVLMGIYGNSEAYLSDGSQINQSVIGVLGEAESDGFPGSVSLNIGVQGIGNESRWTLGVDGRGNGYPDGLSTGIAMGVRGSAGGGVLNIGVYGEVSNPSDASGYFSGGSFVTSGAPIIMSDQAVKNTVESIENASSILSQLSPKTYFYQSPENRPIAFHEGIQYGFIAQEVQAVLPSIVHMTTTPELIDSTGIVEGTSVDLLGIQYTSIIPLLVAGFNEQAATISGQDGLLATQAESIAELEAQIAEQNAIIESLSEQMGSVLQAVEFMQQKTQNCCQQENHGGQGLEPTQKRMPSLMELGQNIPNPFEYSTRIDFFLPTDAEVILEISDAQGRPLRTLIDGKMGGGNHTTTFDGSGLASGIYYYSLYANGELITKRMMKL